MHELENLEISHDGKLLERPAVAGAGVDPQSQAARDRRSGKGKRRGGLKDKRANQRRLLRAYAVCGSIEKAAKASGVSRSRGFTWQRDVADDWFQKQLAIAHKMFCDKLEYEAYRRAKMGIRKYKFTKDGKPIKHPVTGEPYYENYGSDLLMIALLNANIPEKYKHRQDVNVSGSMQHHHSGKVRVYIPDNSRAATAPANRISGLIPSAN